MVHVHVWGIYSWKHILKTPIFWVKCLSRRIRRKRGKGSKRREGGRCHGWRLKVREERGKGISGQKTQKHPRSCWFMYIYLLPCFYSILLRCFHEIKAPFVTVFLLIINLAIIWVFCCTINTCWAFIQVFCVISL